MTQIFKLRDADRKVQEFLDARKTSGEECIVQGDDDQPIVAILPAQQYQAYQEYLRRREQNFAVLDRIAKKTKDVDPEIIEQKIEQAVEEVKAQSRPVTT